MYCSYPDLLFQLHLYSNSFNQNVEKSTQEEDKGEDAGPLGNNLLVFT